MEQLPGIGKPGDRSFGKPRPTLGFKITDDDDFATTLKFQPTGFSETSCVPKNNATSLKTKLVVTVIAMRVSDLIREHLNKQIVLVRVFRVFTVVHWRFLFWDSVPCRSVIGVRRFVTAWSHLRGSECPRI